MSRATEITTSRRGDVTNARDKQTVLCRLLISNFDRRLLRLRQSLILLFVTILQKYISTLRIVWTRRCCFYHESKMGMTPQWLLCTLKGSGSGSLRSTRPRLFSYIVCEYYTQCSLYMHDRLNIRHMRNKWRAVNIYILPPVRQF